MVLNNLRAFGKMPSLFWPWQILKLQPAVVDVAPAEGAGAGGSWVVDVVDVR